MPPFQSRSTGAARIAFISSAGVIDVTPLGRPSAAAICALIGIDLAAAGPDPAAGGDQAAVVVVPRRARQVEQPPPLGERRRGVRRRVEEDVPVVEGRDQPDVLGEQHAVAEDVAGHVADADDGEVLGLGVHAELAEVPLDRLPRALGGDAHRLVVVADRAAGGEGVAEPEAVVDAPRRWRCRRRSRCPCRRRRPGRCRRSSCRTTRWRRIHLSPSTRLSVMSSSAEMNVV